MKQCLGCYYNEDWGCILKECRYEDNVEIRDSEEIAAPQKDENVVLQKCPFCGEEIELKIVEQTVYVVYCLSCNMHGPSAETEEMAIIRWNNRV